MAGLNGLELVQRGVHDVVEEAQMHGHAGVFPVRLTDELLKDVLPGRLPIGDDPFDSVAVGHFEEAMIFGIRATTTELAVELCDAFSILT